MSFDKKNGYEMSMGTGYKGAFNKFQIQVKHLNITTDVSSLYHVIISTHGPAVVHVNLTFCAGVILNVCNKKGFVSE